MIDDNGVEISQGLVVAPKPMNPMVQVAVQTKVAEIQARITLAQAKPRNWDQIADQLTGKPDGLCWEAQLAEQAVWEYPKGGQNLSGPSIRLLETIARLAGNIDYGINTLAVTEEGTYCEVYCLDLETNAKARKEIFVPHEAPRWNREARRMEKTRLTDDREVYEHTANLGTRRLRSCMEAVLPKALLDDCVRVCDQVVLAQAGLNEDSVKKMVTAFGKVGVTPQQLDKWLGYPLAKITPRRFVRLRRIYQSIADGYAAPSDWFRGASQARVVEERLKAGKGSAQEGIVAQGASDAHESGSKKVEGPDWKTATEETATWKMSEAEIEAIGKEQDEWVEAATGDLKL